MTMDVADKRRRLLEKMLRERGLDPGAGEAAGPAADGIPRSAPEGPAPVSFGQRRLYFLARLEPSSSAYNLADGVRLAGPVDAAVLARSLDFVTERQESLRTAFVLDGDEPVQVVRPDLAPRLATADLSALPEAVRGAEAGRLADRLGRLPFDLETGPVARAALLRLDGRDHVLALVVHHAVSDGWSVGVLMDELIAAYGALGAGGRPDLPELPIRYRDFAVWQRERLSGDGLTELATFWRDHLAGAPRLLDLPTDRPRPPVQTAAGWRHPVAIPAATAEALREQGRAAGATPFMVLLALYGVWLRRHTGQLDLVIGSPAANRGRPEVARLVGFFVNTLVHRLDLADDPTFGELLARVRAEVLEVDEHQDLPFERLVDLLDLPRDLSHAPVFQVMLTLQNLPPASGRPEGLSLARFGIETRSTQFDLHLILAEGPEGIRGDLEARADLFDRDTVERMARSFEGLAEEVAAAPEWRVSALGLPGGAERRLLVEEWGGPAVARPEGATLLDLMARQAAATPDAPAVVFDGETLSYAELHERARSLAGRLAALGVGPEERVGIAVPRSADLMVALLAVFHAGGAYVPLDLDYPAERVAFMVDGSAPALVLARDGHLEGLPEGTVIETVTPASGASRVPGEPGGPAGEGSLAYVIYTSGSTGRPKGAMIEHRSIVNRLLWMQDAYGLGPGDTVLQKTPTSFDVSVWELFWPLLAGARLVLAPPGLHRDSAGLAELVTDAGVTVMHFVPSMLQVFVDEPAAADCTSLRLVVSSGEALPRELARRLFELLPDVRLENLYGPTEAAVDVTHHQVRPQGSGPVPLGRPIANTAIRILDRRLELAPVGVLGELAIGGVNVGRGYLGRPALTAERFVPDPFATGTPFGAAGDRLYRTGDLARVRGDGVIDYAGRLDHQVKVRGVRIELGEIQACLEQHPRVREAVVTTRDDGPGGHARLVAYAVAGDDGAPDLAAVQDHVRAHLPEAMVPAALVVLDTLPLTPNGKVDRKALPAPTAAARTDGPPVAPTNEIEAALAEVWEQVLGIDRVGIRDNFFVLGGDSILSLRVLSSARERGLELELDDLFQHQTVEELARRAALGGRASMARMAPIAPFELISDGDRERLPDDVEDAYPLAKLQAGMLFHGELGAETSLYHNTVSMDLVAPVDVDALVSAIRSLADRHELLRTTFDLAGYGEPLQLVHRRVEIPVAVEDLRHLSNDEQEAELARWFEVERRNLFDWHQAPLARFQIHLRGDDRFQLSWSEHHAILDGWSVASMITEVSRHYFALLAEGDGAVAPAPPASRYRDFVAQERALLASDEARRFWLEELRGSTFAALTEGADDEAPAAIEAHTEPLPEELTVGARRVARDLGVPMKSLLLAVHARTLALATGMLDLTTGMVTNGRLEEPDAERVLGLFLNTLPLRFQVADGSWSELVRAAFEAERRSLPFRRFPLAEIQRLAGGRALFEATFTYLHYHVMQSFASAEHITDERGVEGRGTRSDIPTNFTLSTYFLLDPFSAQLDLVLDYDARRLDAAFAERLAGWYRRALEALVADPAASVRRVSLLADSERRQVVEEWNPAAPAAVAGVVVGDDTLVTLFETQVDRTPDAPALVFEGDALTYRQLDEAANRMAHRLMELGVGPETRVGVALERSLDLLVTLYGVEKAGASYVPLDPGYPAERLRAMANDAGLAALVTDVGTPLADGPESAPRLLLSAEREHLAARPATRPAPRALADHPAYVIYTSGSTGRPKGVTNAHRGIVNRLRWMQRAYPLGPGDTVLQKTPASFDVSVWELFWPLQVGARLAIARPEGHKDPDYLEAAIAEHGVTTIHFVPCMLRAFLDGARLEGPTPLRRVISSGEALPAELVERTADRLAGVELHNLYGPTEAAVDVTAWPCSSADGHAGTAVPIGRPIDGVVIFLADSFGHLVPHGVAGELAIGGVAPARGYHDRPALTAERFVPDPWSGQAGARLYRTGDLARRRDDGALVYLGRIDHQVKLRGQRIELGEIEDALLAHPAVREGVVALAGSGDDARLVAYLVPDREAGDDGGGREERQEMVGEQVDHWRMVFEDTYVEGAGSPEVSREGSAETGDLDLAGWVSSYTGEAIVEAEMVEWVEATVERILARRPRRVLELGCGTGLLLLRIAPRVERYLGTDFSPTVLERLGRRVAAAGIDGVELSERPAHRLDDLPAGGFDAVVINSVAQYFPGVEYLLEVLEGAVERLADGGFLFLGDVRNLALLRTFHASVELARSGASVSVAELGRRVNARVAEDGELALDPRLFAWVAERLPRVAAVHAWSKRGAAGHEMNRYRYDVVFEVGPRDDGEPMPPARQLDWSRAGGDADGLLGWIESQAPERLVVTGVPDARVARDLRAAEILSGASESIDVGDLRVVLQQAGEPEALDVQAFRRRVEPLGYDLEASCVGTGSDGASGRVDLLLWRRGTAPPPAPRPRVEGLQPAELANDPLAGRFLARLLPDLRRRLGERLPEHMVPGSFVVLDELPLTPSGKLDRRSLPDPEPRRPDDQRTYVAPRTPVEERLATIWADVLRLDRVGVDDHLFEIGGHSLLATQIVVRIRESFQIELSLGTLYRAPTVGELALEVLEARAEDTDEATLEHLLGQVEGLTSEELELLLEAEGEEADR